MPHVSGARALLEQAFARALQAAAPAVCLPPALAGLEHRPESVEICPDRARRSGRGEQERARDGERGHEEEAGAQAQGVRSTASRNSSFVSFSKPKSSA